jgi:hypothetical protein
MALNLKTLPQSSFGLAGYWGLQESVTIPFYNYESNSSNYFGIKDWGISLQYGAEFSVCIFLQLLKSLAIILCQPDSHRVTKKNFYLQQVNL